LWLPELKYRWKNFKNRMFTNILDWFMIQPNIAVHNLRTAFRSTELPAIFGSDRSHTHPKSAAWRSSCLSVANLFCHRVGLKPYSYQASTTDVRDGIRGSRTYWWAKDVTTVPLDDPVLKNDLVVMVDVDYYVELTEFLCHTDQPLLLYSFQPKAVSEAKGEFVFTFENDKVLYSVSGGACYNHQVWNYSVDVFTVSYGLTTKSFIVERKKANDHHEYILLVPMGKWRGIGSLFARLLGSDSLERLSISHGAFNVMDVHTGDGMIRSVGRQGTYNCATIPTKSFDAIESVVRNSSIKVGNAVMQSWVDNDKHAATVLVDYFNSRPISIKFPVVYTPAQGIKRYQFVDESGYDADSASLMVPFMSPVLPTTYVPDKCLSNEKQAVNARVIAPQKDSVDLCKQPSKFLIQCMTEYIECIVPIKHEGIPCDVEDVYARQSKPSQQTILVRAENVGPDEQVKSLETFLKAEPYEKPSDPRIITQFGGVSKRDYACFMYPFSDHTTKTCKWYAFGKSPLEIAYGVTEICENAKSSVNCADSVRQDGHVSKLGRDLELGLLVAYFRPEYLEKVTNLQNSQFNRRAVTKMGFKYEYSYQRGSGSGETAVMNSHETKFQDFYARRKLGYSVRDSYDAKGMFGGDDSVAADMPAKSLESASAEIGQRVESNIFMKGSFGVNFLSRFYGAEVWNGDASSTCDLPRALSKLHVTPHLGNVTPLAKLQQKLMGLQQTDSNSPVIDKIITAAIRVRVLDLVKVPAIDSRIVSWWALYDKEENWPNLIDDQSIYFDKMLPRVNTEQLYKYLDDVKTPEELLTMPSILALEEVATILPKATAVVGDELHVVTEGNTPLKPVTVPEPSAPEIPISPSSPSDAQKAKETAEFDKQASIIKLAGQATDKVCWDYFDGKCSFGKKCTLRHAKVCKDFVAGKCDRKLGHCKFEHCVRDQGRAPIVSQPSVSVPQSTSSPSLVLPTLPASCVPPGPVTFTTPPKFTFTLTNPFAALSLSESKPSIPSLETTVKPLPAVVPLSSSSVVTQ
jgi:hypothetical protein